VQMEIRRKSGRGIKEVFVLSNADSKPANQVEGAFGIESNIFLLDDHPAYTAKSVEAEGDQQGEEVPDTTFKLGLTDKQKKDREGVILPYFDAQKGDGPGEGGRILYEMGREDDWDPEEDEI